MVNCLYNDIHDCECAWQGTDSEILEHLTKDHGVLMYTIVDQNNIVLELTVDTEYSGYKYVILEFIKNGKRIVMIFEELFDETLNIFKLGVRSVNAAGTMYKILLQGSSSSIWYCGELMDLQKVHFPKHHQCLEVHKAQMNKFCYLSDNEITYKLIVSLTN